MVKIPKIALQGLLKVVEEAHGQVCATLSIAILQPCYSIATYAFEADFCGYFNSATGEIR